VEPRARGARGPRPAAPRDPRRLRALGVRRHVHDARRTRRRPSTDFGGFPAELYAMRYPAPGDAVLARRAARLTGGSAADGRGLDHGTWSVLHRMFPADVPVVQLSLDVRVTAAEHLALGTRAPSPARRRRADPRERQLTHDLRDAFSRMRRGDASTPDWAARFDGDAARALAPRDEASGSFAPSTRPTGAARTDGRALAPDPLRRGGRGCGRRRQLPLTGVDLDRCRCARPLR